MTTKIEADEYKSSWTACLLQDPEDYSIECEDTFIDCGECKIQIKETEDYEKEVAAHRAKYFCPDCGEQKKPVQTEQKTELLTYEATRWLCVNPTCETALNSKEIRTNP